MKRITETSLTFFFLLVVGGGCPSSAEPAAIDAGSGAGTADAESGAAATHEGTISIQDRAIHGLPQAGHGLTVSIEFTPPWRRPDFDEMPGSPAGCKVWLYDLATETPPAPVGDVGVVTIAGASAPVPNGCWVEPPGGTVCPAVTGRGRAMLRHAGADLPAGTARFELGEGSHFGPDDRGRYLALESDPAGDNDGLYPILGVLAPTTLLLRKPPGTDSEPRDTPPPTAAPAK